MFLGNWKSTLIIAISIRFRFCVSVLAEPTLGETIKHHGRWAAGAGPVGFWWTTPP